MTAALVSVLTRDPATGENQMFGEYLVNAQGEDVVAGNQNTQADPGHVQ